MLINAYKSACIKCKQLVRLFSFPPSRPTSIKNMQHKLPKVSRLYGAGGYYDTHLACSDLTEYDPENGQVSELAEVCPMDIYTRPAPCFFTKDKSFEATIRELQSAINRDYRHSAPSILYKIRNCIVFDTVIYVIENGRPSIFYTTHRSHERPHVKTLDCEANVIVADKVISGYNRSVFYLSSAASFNYGHWLIDDLPRVKAINDVDGPITIVLQSVGPDMDRVRIESIRYLFPERDIEFEFVDKRDVLICDELLYATPVSYHPVIKNRDALKFLNQAATRQAVTPVEGGGKRIFIMRGGSHTRNIKNLKDLLPMLIGLGFEVIEPEKFGFDDQVAMFSNASIIVGIMGASMCNTVFSPKGTKLVYLAPNGWVEPFYWDLACLMDHEYTVLYGERAQSVSDASFDDFLVDVAQLSSILQA